MAEWSSGTKGGHGGALYRSFVVLRMQSTCNAAANVHLLASNVTRSRFIANTFVRCNRVPG